jgi:hypothetical protein
MVQNILEHIEFLTATLWRLFMLLELFTSKGLLTLDNHNVLAKYND